jgi:uncharacterized membrane protein YgdD (TMEM256/DUF423 family)
MNTDFLVGNFGLANRTVALSSEMKMNPDNVKTFALRVAAAAGLLAVALGAFGAHGLKDWLARNETAAIWEKAVFYHFIHAVVLFVLAGRKRFAALAWWSFLAGILLFSGSLYLFALTKIHGLVFITPLGGVSFLAGWAALFFQARQQVE